MFYNFYQLVCIFIVSLTLSGCLPAIFTGTATSAVEFAKDRSASDTLTDIKISTSIKASLIKNNFHHLYTRMKVDVVKGRVLFTGTISKAQYALIAVQTAWKQKGVNAVINELEIDPTSGTFDCVQYARDVLITSQIKSKIFMDRSIKFINYTIITSNDIVYLFGISQSQEELEKVANIASKIRKVRKVISHTHVKRASHKKKPHDSYAIPAENKFLIDHDIEDDGTIYSEDDELIAP